MYKRQEINSTLELMRKIRKRECEAPENYKDTAMLFEVLGYRYIEKLEKLYTRTEFIKNKSVSYTHLDVYKRQEYCCDVNWINILSKVNMC